MATHVGTLDILLLIWSGGMYFNFQFFSLNIETSKNLEMKTEYNCCDFSFNRPRLIPFTWMAEDKYLGQELSVNRKEFKSCLWDGLIKAINEKSVHI